MKDKTKLLGEEKMGKTLLIMGIPTMVGMIVSALYNLVDAYFVGKLGTLPMAAVSVINPLSYIGMFVGLLFGCGGNSVIARAFGRGDKNKVKKYSATATYTALVVITILILLLLIFVKPVIHVLGGMPEYEEMARSYAIVFIIGLFFNVFNMCMNNMIVAEGNSFTSMVAMLAGAVVNIGLDPILIMRLNMGVTGASVATLIARMISSAIYIAYVLSKKSMLSINPFDYQFGKECIRDIVTVGIPVALFQLINGIGQTLINKLARKYGADAQAALGIVSKVMFLELNLLYGFFKGYSPIIGYNYGAGNIKRVKDATRLALIWSTSATLLMGIFMVVFRNNIIACFNQESAQVLEIGVFALVIYSVSYLTYGCQIIIGNYFIAIGEAKTGGLLSMGKGIIYVGYLILMEMIFGLMGIILAQICADVTGTLITVFAYLNYQKKHNVSENFKPMLLTGYRVQ